MNLKYIYNFFKKIDHKNIHLGICYITYHQKYNMLSRTIFELVKESLDEKLLNECTLKLGQNRTRTGQDIGQDTGQDRT